jgi:glycosyltransferase involved in cell wall biosynthesis
MEGIAFYAPMKAPTDPVPSGDRTMARGLIAALGGIDLGPVRVVSEMLSRDGKGDRQKQDQLMRAATAEKDRIALGRPPRLWITYHSYYKSPDLIGPALAEHWGIPYVQIESTRARKRLAGPYARFAAAAEAACDAADVIFYVTERDYLALERNLRPGQRLVGLRPFLNQEELPPFPDRKAVRARQQFLACAMFRPGDKFESYTALAAALTLVQSSDWCLTIVGDGPKRADVAAMYAGFGNRVRFTGALDPPSLAELYAGADLLLWPGVNEAYGMVYLEAQAHGCPVLAEDRPGVRDIVRDGGWLVTPDNAAAYAITIERLMKDADARIQAGRKGRARVAAEHLLPSARQTLKDGLDPLMRK